MGDSGVQKKKLNKNKLKKTIKNVLGRPDPLLWPEVSDNHKNFIEVALGKQKVDLPVFKKPHWNELKLIPKDKRPKTPKLPKVNGLLFGITECCSAIESKHCSVVIIESMVSPRVIVQPVIEACDKAKIPFICCQNLRKTTEQYFGIPTSCLGINGKSLPDLTNTVLEVAKAYTVSQKVPNNNITEVEMMEVDKKSDVTAVRDSVNMTCPYLYRSNKKSRVFVPNTDTVPATVSKDFVGQNYIEFSDKANTSKTDRKAYMKMMVKRISNNPNRVKIK